ncbi:DUF6756 family protein [Candidatus Thiosymbion oneisti]|uniref:DUF6756 family protein n=1 Tax=Candidatus Thiosymbion oneisti TaxID=589554 RepID=UPI000B7F7EA6|nr:DUF6756 family protein [Candidatus Thiosymbion oneisti]
MIEQELLDEIRNVTSSGEIFEMHDYEASSTLGLIQDTFIDPLSGQWWWENLRGESVTIQYGDNDGLSVVSDLVGRAGSVFLVPTDDENPPWPIFIGHIEKIIDLLRELRFFEYFITDKNNTWIVFDTHHNTLVVSGILLDRAKEINTSLS